MILKILILITLVAFGVAALTRGRRKALHAGWIVAGLVAAVLLLAIQILRTLDTMWR